MVSLGIGAGQGKVGLSLSARESLTAQQGRCQSPCRIWHMSMVATDTTDFQGYRRPLFPFEELSFSYKKIMKNKNYIIIEGLLIA